MRTFSNPILPGFYPDPSICRVGEDYYLVTSTFEYFPGVPIFHSRDLINWKQIGHVLDRPSQLNLDGTPSSRGIYAPTIRYHNGIFYMITTFVVSQTGARKNFYVTAEKPEGPWSEPNWLKDAPGIDPSLFFDDDGKVYYTGNRQPPEGQKHAKHMEIWLQELDLEEKQLVGPKFSIWDGALQVAHAQESPHLYKKDGYYYLIIAEGGTGHTHAVTIARSQSISGPYEGNKMNPILTHRHLGRNEPIVNVGHADIVQTQNDEWWMVALASRPYGGYYRNLGRESFLVPFIWEDGWPIVNPGVGKIESEMKRPELPEYRYPAQPYCDHFDSETLGLQWNFIRTPREDFYSLQEQKGFLRLSLKKESLTDEDNPSFIGRRQQHFSFLVETALEFTPSNEHETAGLVLRSNEDFHYLIEFSKKEENEVLKLTSQENGEKTILKEVVVPVEKRKYLKIEALEQDLTIRYSSSTSDNWQVLLEGVDARLISTDVAGGFTGAYIGMYSSSNGKHSENYADFDYFTYQPLT